MGGRLRPAAITTAAVLAGVTALAGCGAADTPVFHPAGALQPQKAAALTAQARVAPGGFRFPAGVSVELTTALPGSAVHRAILAGYRNYVLSLWAAVLSHGRDTAYLHWSSGNAVTFAHREMAYFSRGRAITGTVRYSSLTVTAVYYGRGANVTSCVDASRFVVASAVTGKATGTVFPARYAHYLEDVGEVRRPDGTWYVVQTASYPASTSEGAMCR